jgi:hypothetical protein
VVFLWYFFSSIIYQDAYLDGSRLLSVHTDPLSLDPQKALSLSVLLDLASGNQGLSEKLAKIVQAIQHSEKLPEGSITVGDFVLYPPGVQSGPAVIDQFKSLKINLAIPSSGPTSNGSSEEPSLIDISGLIHGHSLKDLSASPHSAKIETKTGSVLELGAIVDYNNVLPITFKLPFAKTGLYLDGVSLVDPTVYGIELSHGMHSMSPSVSMYFQQKDVSIQDHVAKLVTDLELHKSPDSKLVVKGFYFGASMNDQNDLFSLVELDISKILKTIQMPDLGSLVNSPTEPQIPMISQSPISVHNAAFALLPKKTIALAAELGLNMSLPLSASLNIGVLGAGLLINRNPVLQASINGLKISSEKNLNLSSKIAFDETDETPKDVAWVMHQIQQDQKIGNAIMVAGLFLGSNERDVVHFDILIL